MPNSLLATYYLARLIISEHDLEEIITEEESGLLYRLGVTLSDAGKFDLAALLFKRIVSMQPDSLEGWLDLARYYIYLDDQVQLNKVLQQATTAMPDSSEVYLFWGTALEREGQFDRAIAVYQQGLQRLPASTELYLYWGIALEQQEQLSEAIALYERALAAVGPHAVLEVRWGICLGQKREWQEAQSHYRAAVALDAGNREAHLHWGIALERLERWPEAIEQLRAAAALDRGDTQVLFYLGSCYEQASRHLDDSDYFAHAVETFTRLLAIKSDDAFALNYLGYMYAEKGIQLQEAVDLLLRAIDIEPENSAFFDSLGWAYYRLGEWQQAERYLTKALEYMDGDDTEEQTVILDHAADISWALGKQSVANTYWQRVLDLTPDDEAVRAKVGR
jgi:tetratricopeptide (TPR) repeat protein